MKRNAIGRIVIYSIIILLLLGILAAGLGIGTYTFRIGHSGNYISGSSSVEASKVDNLHIEWASGTITILRGDTDEITFTEEGYYSEERQMVYELRGNTLSLHYSKPSVQIGFVSIEDKDLTITVPMDWECSELQIESASTDLEIRDLTIDVMNLDCASGDCILADCTIRELDMSAASCDIDFSGNLIILDCEGASTDLTAVFYNHPESIDVEGASADLDITLPDDCGFRVDMDGMSSEFSSDFSTKSSDGCYVYGDGHCEINIEGMSATVKLHKGSSRQDENQF